MTRWTASGGWIAMISVMAVACGSGSDDEGAGGGPAEPRTCRGGDPCSEGAECGYSGIESGVSCSCDPSGHFFCDPWAGGGSPPWPPCTEADAKEGYGACEQPETATCTETNGWCTRTCTCGGTCEMLCDGDAAVLPDYPIAVCDESYCGDHDYSSCDFHDGQCSYEVKCDGAEATITGSCP